MTDTLMHRDYDLPNGATCRVELTDTGEGRTPYAIRVLGRRADADDWQDTGAGADYADRRDAEGAFESQCEHIARQLR